MKRKEANLDSPSYMQMALHMDGQESLILRIPTFWDAMEKQWLGAIQTPKTRKLIQAQGRDSQELQENFNIVMKKFLHNPEYSDEIYKMFKPLSEWESEAAT